jgi:hypothetical protein
MREKQRREGKGKKFKGKGKEKLHNLAVVSRCFVPNLIIFLSSKRSALQACALHMDPFSVLRDISRWLYIELETDIVRSWELFMPDQK